MSRLAVVLFNLGGPDSLKAVRPFLFNLFRDPAIIGLPAVARLPLAALIAFTRRKEASENYAHMGGASPLLPETVAQADALQAALGALGRVGDEARCFVAMRYWKPFTEATARAVAAYAPDEVVLLPLYPQYSTTTSGSSLAAWTRAYKGLGRVRTVCCYPTLDGLVQAHADNIVDAWEAAGSPEGLRLLFSAHGLPETIIEGGDPYQWQVERTCEAVAARVTGRLGGETGVVDWRTCYQSRVGPMKWIGPSTPEAIEAAASEGLGVIVTPIAFVSEHVETLVELDRDYAELAERLGCPHYLRVPAVGVSEAFVGGLAAAVRRALVRPAEVESDGCARVCPQAFGRCPARLELAPKGGARLMGDLYDWLRGLHILADIAWMAGLLYLPRLFVYHMKAAPGGEADALFQVMERRLLRGIMNPRHGGGLGVGPRADLVRRHLPLRRLGQVPGRTLDERQADRRRAAHRLPHVPRHRPAAASPRAANPAVGAILEAGQTRSPFALAIVMVLAVTVGVRPRDDPCACWGKPVWRRSLAWLLTRTWRRARPTSSASHADEREAQAARGRPRDRGGAGVEFRVAAGRLGEARGTRRGVASLPAAPGAADAWWGRRRQRGAVLLQGWRGLR